MPKGKRTAAKDMTAGKDTTQALWIQCWHVCRAKLTGKLKRNVSKKC